MSNKDVLEFDVDDLDFFLWWCCYWQEF
jgi:hypothetical protein